jgi:hypothetical protein
VRSRNVLLVALAIVMASSAPAGAGSAIVERVENVSTVVAVGFPEDFPIGSLSRAECHFVQRVTLPDGSATETQTCELSDEPVMIPAFQGSAPRQALVHEGGPCEWSSDFAFVRYGADEYAESYRLLVTPAGRVYVWSSYPSESLDCG